jgi:hypothetical protein
LSKTKTKAILDKHITHKNILPTIASKTTKEYEGAFFFLTGLLGGIAMNDVWKMFKLPGNDQPWPKADGTPSEYDMDFIYQAAIGGALIALDYLIGMKDGAPLGAGIILGSRWANLSEKGHYIGNMGLII